MNELTWWDNYINSIKSFKTQNWERRIRVNRIVLELYSKIPWMNWPILKYVFMFWNTVFDEGIYQTCKPRWGAITFSYLNDGFKPTLWHTWRQLTHDYTDPYTGIYSNGAPRSLKQAQEWEDKWIEERKGQVGF